ncbi:MAG: ABC transporter ATP-binding protein, partial [Eubacteriales bacterium]|nr:ABC transporter ATP-binding protein [Eubacteriales bacterium]
MFKTLKRLMAMVKRRGRYLAGLAIISVVSASTNVIMAFALKLFIRAAQSQDMQILYRSIAFMAGGLFLLLVLMPLGYWLYETSVVGGTANMRSLVFKGVLRIKTSWLDARHSGDLTSRATNDIQVAEKAYSLNLVQLVELLMEGIASTVVMFIADWKLALPLVFLGLISVWINRRLARPMEQAANAVQKALGVVTERISDIANGNQIIRLFNSRPKIEAKFQEQNQDAVAKGLTRTKYAARVNCFSTLAGYFSFLILAMVGGWLVIKGWYDLGTIMLFTQLQNGVRNMFAAMGHYITDLQTSLAGGRRVLEILDAPKEPERIALPAAPAANSAAVNLDAVTFAYNGGEPALENVSLQVQPGETVALV